MGIWCPCAALIRRRSLGATLGLDPVGKALGSLILAVVAVVALVTKRPMTVALVLLSLAIVLLTFDTPLSIGVCKSADMACQSTALWLRIAGGISAVATLAGALLNPDRKRVTE